MPVEWKEVRDDFPALQGYIYLNAAAASPIPRPVTEAVTTYYRDLGQSGDLLWDDWLEQRERARASIAKLINADTDEIAFVSNTSAGINAIVDLIGKDGPVLSDELEFPTVTLPWLHRGIPVHVVPAIEGVLRLEQFQAEYAPRASTVAISHVQFSNGCRQDLGAFGELKADRHFVVCASQSMGAFPVDVKESRIDALASAGHKWMCAGYGAGFVYIKKELIEKHPPHSIGWLSVEDPYKFDIMNFETLKSNRRIEAGCPAFASVFALEAAANYLMDLDLEAIAERVLYLNEYLTFRLERRKFTILSPGGDYRSGQTLCAVAEPETCVEFLKEKGILVTCKPEGVRIATHFYNSEDDIETCVAALTDWARDHSLEEESLGD